MLISLPALSDDGIGVQAPAPLAPGLIPLCCCLSPVGAAASLSCWCCCHPATVTPAPAADADAAAVFKTSTISNCGGLEGVHACFLLVRYPSPGVTGAPLDAEGAAAGVPSAANACAPVTVAPGAPFAAACP